MKNSQDIILENFLKLKLSEVVKVPIIAIYKHPKDYQGKYVARLWDIGIKPSQYVLVKDTLEEVREAIPKYMQRIGPTNQDDPVIIETWI